MTIIKGLILNTGGTLLTGKVRVTYAGIVFDESTTPNKIYFPLESFFDITNGILNINVYQTETSNVSCEFAFFELDSNNELIFPPFKTINFIIPDESEIEFSQYIETGVVNNQLDTSARRIARLITSDPSLASKVIGPPYPQGDYNPLAIYTYGDMVSYNNQNYISKSYNPLRNIPPTDLNNWYKWQIPPTTQQTGTPIIGDSTPYGVAWNGSTLAPSQDELYSVFQTIFPALGSTIDLTPFARLSGANFTGKVNLVSTSITDDSSEAVSSEWVNDYIDTFLQSGPVFNGEIPRSPTPSFDSHFLSIANLDILKKICQPSFFVSSNILSTTNSNDFKIPWNTVNFDTNNCFANSEFTVPVGYGGKYIFGGGAYLRNDSSTLNSFAVFIRHPLGTYRLCESYLMPTYAWFHSFAIIVLPLNAGDKVHVFATNFNSNPGNNINYNIGETFFGTNYFWGFRLPI